MLALLDKLLQLFQIYHSVFHLFQADSRSPDVIQRFANQSEDALGLYAHLYDKFVVDGYRAVQLEKLPVVAVSALGSSKFQEV